MQEKVKFLKLTSRLCRECQMGGSPHKTTTFHFYRPQRSWDKVMFLQASVILSTGGEYLTRFTPQNQVHPPTWTRYPPRTRYTPSGPGTPPSLRDQVHPPDQVHPTTRYHPPDQVHTPQTSCVPRTRYTPWHRACWEIRSTCGWYASYWNAFL